ncbi:hypothetical protein EVAR_12367_1 [Eumeta japonica]|uniref:SWIM-type domain-containing protein n=1 Tax=Eumeta variegata TaxID=151549 RepID=A0A4C1WZ06_EUMVA|nr:hypothetical protein EVAR_12367_1 [Eumeta japonica]
MGDLDCAVRHHTPLVVHAHSLTHTKLSLFLQSSRCKLIGHKLFQSHHVQEVVEIRDSGGGFIHGKVTPQTRVNNRPYDVKVEVNLDRTVRRTECTCKAGLSVRGCKHVAAVCIFINNECTQSKTDQPQCWNQPRESQVEKYKKGCTIAQMFPGQEHLIDCNATYTFNDVQNVPYCTEGSLFGQYIQSEKDIEPLREIAREEEEKGKKKRI